MEAKLDFVGFCNSFGLKTLTSDTPQAQYLIYLKTRILPFWSYHVVSNFYGSFILFLWF